MAGCGSSTSRGIRAQPRQAGAASLRDSENEEGEQEQQVERLIRETADPLPVGGSWQNEAQQQQQQHQKQGAVQPSG